MKIMSKTLLFLTIILIAFSVNAQKFITQTGNIRFYSKTPLEDIEAYNNQVSGVLNADNGEMAFSLLMRAFTFEKALMQEHFNEKYVESHKFPKATFKGKIIGFNKQLLTDKPLEVNVRGTLNMHGETREIETKGTLQRTKDGRITGRSVFKINLKDFKIKVPDAVRKNISDNIEIHVNMNYEKLEQ